MQIVFYLVNFLQAKKNQEKKEQLLRRQQQQAAENSSNLDTDSMNDDTVGRKAPRIDDPAYSPEMQVMGAEWYHLKDWFRLYTFFFSHFFFISNWSFELIYFILEV